MSTRDRKLRVAVIGQDGRTSAIKGLLEASPRIDGEVRTLSSGKGPESVREAIEAARTFQPDFVVIGPEEPLAFGAVDELRTKLGIPSVGPTQELAKLESSKAFTRQLLTEYGIPGNPRHAFFHSIEGIEEYLTSLGDFVIKPDGLTGGKGVKVSGVHVHSISEALDYCRQLLLEKQPCVAIEEKLDGEEFSLQSFCDGSHVAHMVVVQDHKRAYAGDTGPNTGGMGSYTYADHGLPFVSDEMIAAAKAINEEIPKALFKKTNQKYKGILFGGFMATKDGVRLLEYNARFGDPEALNVLSLLETDLCEIFEAVIAETLDPAIVKFRHKATVCKYIVPKGYPGPMVAPGMIDNVPTESENLRIYWAAIEKRDEHIWLTGSRALAIVGLGDTLAEANEIAENAASTVTGPVRYRKDIGTQELIDRRIAHMRLVRRGSPAVEVHAQ